ncbi:hypothetical protein [Planctomycetes bacterium K23_9]|uniref:SHOCT domain-containing protein n=1 Tax=Stieleria marina TaxID=1930275 RepID=A0A517NPP6_9BACT|nr:hypothetical protein K239x_10500 [Planctomycetes bacterium K23_9]
MRDLLDDPMVVAAGAFLVIAGGCAIVFYVARSLRDSADEDQQDAEQMLANLKEMHLRGDITDEEFRVIKLANQTHTQAKANDLTSSDHSEDQTESTNDSDEPTQN